MDWGNEPGLQRHDSPLSERVPIGAASAPPRGSFSPAWVAEVALKSASRNSPKFKERTRPGFGYSPHVRPNHQQRVARALALLLVGAALVIGVVLMSRGAVQGIALVLSAGLLGAAYARLVLNWHPDSNGDQLANPSAPPPEDARDSS